MATVKASGEGGACASMPRLARLSYFHGQMLGAYDLRGESAYVRDKLRLAVRYLHGWGVVCGFEVEAVAPDPDCAAPPPDESARAGVWLVTVAAGVGFDCHGDQVVLRDTVPVDLWCALPAADRGQVEAGCDAVYVSVCYRERPVEPARPVLIDSCGVPAACAHARILETACVRVGVEPPDPGARCERCCAQCPDPCLLVAKITGLQAGQPVEPGMIDGGVRRMIARHRLTTVTGINWVHGATYPSETADRLLLDDGIELRFSDPVRVDTLRPGVVEMIVYTGGLGQANTMIVKPGEFVDLPADGYADRLVYRANDDEGLQNADRVLVRVRTDFLLDECCRAVDGNHLGGRVPLLEEYRESYGADPPPGCPSPSARPGAWTSGNGTEGGVFESWFFVEQRERGHEYRRRAR